MPVFSRCTETAGRNLGIVESRLTWRAVSTKVIRTFKTKADGDGLTKTTVKTVVGCGFYPADSEQSLGVRRSICPDSTTRTLSGVIVTDKNESVAGVTLIVRSSSGEQKAVSDDDGRFILTIPNVPLIVRTRGEEPAADRNHCRPQRPNREPATQSKVRHSPNPREHRHSGRGARPYHRPAKRHRSTRTRYSDETTS